MAKASRSRLPLKLFDVISRGTLAGLRARKDVAIVNHIVGPLLCGLYVALGWKKLSFSRLLKLKG